MIIENISNSESVVNYALRQLALRAGISNTSKKGTGFESLDIDFIYDKPENANCSKSSIIIVPTCPINYKKILSSKTTIDWIFYKSIKTPGNCQKIEKRLPVLFWGENRENRCFYEWNERGSIIINVDIIAATVFMLTRWEELVSDNEDAHKRFPASASVSYKQGFIDLPIVDLYAIILREIISILRPSVNFARPSFTIKLSHDVDLVRHFSNPKIFIKDVGRTFIRKYKLMNIFNSIQGFLFADKDPYFRGIYELAKISMDSGFRGDTFYFMSSKSKNFGSDYDISSPLIKKVTKYLINNGFEVGFHAGYSTMDSYVSFVNEWKLFNKYEDLNYSSSRQHYLRFKVPTTWEYLDKLGINQDSSLAYSDCEGFRCGTCFPFHPYNILEGKEYDLLEYPLIAMDVTLKNYRRLSPDETLNRLLNLADRCKEVGGVFTVLWHNTSLHYGWDEWADKYIEFLRLASKFDL